MINSELDKLSQKERNDFLRIQKIPPHERTSVQVQRMTYITSIINMQTYFFQLRSEEASMTQDIYAKIIRRCPDYVLETRYGELKLPKNLVPNEIKLAPKKGVYPNMLFATITADLEKMAITSFEFKEYLRMFTKSDKDKIKSLDSLPKGKWPKK